MTICIGFIPNKKTAMLMQDSEVTYPGIDLTQDIAEKIVSINSYAIAGRIGVALYAEEILDLLKRSGDIKDSLELKARLEDAYHTIRSRKFTVGILRQFGFNDVKDISAPNVDPEIRKVILEKAGNPQGFGVEIMVAYNYDGPGLYIVSFPGTAIMTKETKGYFASGTGGIKAIDIMGNVLERFRWQSDLSLEDAVLTMIDAGIASEKKTGVKRPFRISYVIRDIPEGFKVEESKIETLDTKMLNMVLHAKPHTNEEVIRDAVKLLLKPMKKEDVEQRIREIVDYLKSKVNLGVEFDNYFGLKK